MQTERSMVAASLTAPKPGRMSVDAVDGFGRSSVENYSCANKLGGGWEREKIQRAFRRYDNGRGNDIGSRLLLLAVAIMAARALPPQTDRRRKKRLDVE